MKGLTRSPSFWLTLFLAFYLSGRFFGPNDLNTKDQPRTVAYTVDILQNGNWKCPVDMMGLPATKPPLYNWIAALPIAATGVYHTFTFKLPSLLAGFGCLFFIMLYLRHLESTSSEHPIPFAPVFGLSALAWFANSTVYGLLYTARPDMLLAFFLFAGWTVATLLMEQSPQVHSRRHLWSAVFWLCILAAILTKGTPALLLLLYLPVYAVLRFRSLRPVLLTQPLLGLPLVGLAVFFWFRAAWIELPQTHKDYLLQTESSRIAGGGIWESLKEIYQMPQYFLVRFAPWSLVFLWLLANVHRGRIARPPWAPVYIWFLLVLIFFSIPTFKRDDYLLPVYPVCSLAAGYAAWRLPKRFRLALIGSAVLLISLLIGQDFFTKDHLLPRYGDNCARFARQVRLAMPPEASLHFRQTGYNNLQAFLGRNSPLRGFRTSQLRPGDYLLQPAYLLTPGQALAHRLHGPDLPSYQEVPPPEGLHLQSLFLSAPLSNVSGNKPGIVGLFRVLPSPEQPPSVP